MVIRETCPACGSPRYKKNGHPRHGKQNHQCTVCERQVRASAEHLIIAEERRPVSANLLRERISLRGSCRAVAVSRQRLAFHVGGRSRERAQARGANLPQGYQHHATFHPEASITVSATPDDLFHQAKEPK